MRNLLLWAALAGMAVASAWGADAPSITLFRHVGLVSEMQWQHAATDAAYAIHFQDQLDDGIWRLAPSDDPFPVEGDRWLSPPVTNAARFYRLSAVPAAERGKVLSATLAGTMSAVLLDYIFDQAGIPVTPQYDVRIYTVLYETIAPACGRTLASGVLVLPESAGAPLPLACYQHGTITQTNKAPSSLDIMGEFGIAVALGTSGYAATIPDYLGLGSSPGFHPYHHARSQATAGVDLLRAARTVCASNNVPLSGRLFLCGYSQGGHAAMALLRELEIFHTNEFTVTACAPMAGAYDLSGTTTADFLSARPKPNPYYFLYLLAAFQEVYRFAPSLADLLVAPYNATLPPLLNGNTTGNQLNQAMPPDPVAILKPEYLSAFRANPRHPLRLALQDNDLHRWKPRAPMRLYHCSGDRDVVPANSQAAYASFHAQGATQVELIDPQPGADHGGCAQPSLLLAKSWFDSLK